MAEIMMLPGPESVINPAINQIAGAVDKYLNPNRAFQEGMQKALATNPQLMQQLVDVEKVNPGTLRNMGFGKVGDLLSRMEESEESEFNRTNRAGIKQNKQTTLENEMTKNEGVKRDLEKAAKYIAQHTDMSFTAALKMIGQTPTEAKTDELQLQVAEANAKIKAAELGGLDQRAKLSAQDTTNKLTQSEMEADALRNAKVMLPDGVEVDTRLEARNFLDGKMDGNKLAALLANPKTSAQFQANLNLLKSDRERDAALAKENRERKDRKDRTPNDVTATTEYNTAMRMYLTHGEVADIPTWNKALHDPDTIEIVDRLSKNPGSMKPGEEKLLEVAKAMGNTVDKQRLKEISKVGQEIVIQFQKLEESTDKSRQVNLDYMNTLLKRRAAHGGPSIQVKYNEGSYGFGSGYEYIDTKGTVYTEPEVQELLADPLKGTATGLSPRAQAAYEAVMAHPAGPEAAFAALKARGGPRIVAEVEEVLTTEGVLGKRKKGLPANRLYDPRTWKKRGTEE